MSAQLVNFEAEAALCGAMMANAQIVDAIADRLDVDDFSNGMMGRVYSAIVREHSLGRRANPVTLRPYFADDPDMAECGGPGFLAQLTGSANIVGAGDFAQQIADLATRRRLIEGLHKAIALAEDPTQGPEALIEAADTAIAQARDQGDGIHQPSASQCLDEVIATFDAPVIGVECGSIPSIDKLLGPMRPSHLIIGAGRPGMGKTASAISYALGAASRGHGVLFVSLEMGSADLGGRMAADMCLDHRVPYEAIRDGRLSREQQRHVFRARDRVAGMPLTIIDAGSMTVGKLRTLVRRHARRMAAAGHKLELVIVDYLQLLRPDHKMNSAYEAVSEISRTLKAIAKDQGVAVFALTQLSREVEKRADKRPQLSDLRDSGQIEQDADAVLFFLRDEYYLQQQTEPDPNSTEYADWRKAMDRCAGRIEFICAKRRNGRTGAMFGLFHGHFQAVRG